MLVVSPQPFFEERGTPIAVRDVCLALVELGFRVDLLTLPIGERVSLPGVNIIRVENPFNLDSIPIGFSKHKLVFAALIWRKLCDLVRQNNYYRVHAVEEAVFLAQMTPGISKEMVVYDMASSLAQHFEPGPVNSVLTKLESATLGRIGYVICSAGLGTRVQPQRPSGTAGAGYHEWWFPPPPVVGHPTAAEDLRNAMGISNDHKVILYAGSLAKYQGFDQVTSAIPEVLQRRKDAVFVIVGGSDEESSRIRSSLAHVDLGRVRIYSKLPRDIVSDLYGMADILLSPRAETDNVPLKVFEYLAAGKPIVASDVVGHRAVLSEEICAFFGGKNHTSLNEVLIRLLGDAGERQRLAKAASAYADEHIGWNQFLRGINRAYPIGASNVVGLACGLRGECVSRAKNRAADDARAVFLSKCESNRHPALETGSAEKREG